jgi:transposase
MSERREFGTILSANRRRNCQFNSTQKAVIVEQLSSGKTHRQVAATFKTSPSTTHAIFKRWRNDQSLEIKPHIGRLSKLTKVEKKYIILLTKWNKKITYKALIGAMGGRVSKSTIRRVLNEKWKCKWKAMNRIPISRECSKVRLDFAQGWIPDIDELMEVFTIEVGV